MKRIPLTQGKFALVDDEDYDRLVAMGSWQFLKNGYATTDLWENKKPRKVYMHRVILGLSVGDKLVVDHVDLDKLNNQKLNLRTCKQYQNSANRGLNKNNSSGYKGVCFDKRKNKWMAKIQVNRKYMFCGYETTPELAALRYNEFAQKHFGEFAVLNQVSV
jgi:hypothetical protein